LKPLAIAHAEGHLDGAEQLHRASAEILAASITGLARKMNAPLIVLKEFSAQYRDSLQCLLHHGFALVPSMRDMTSTLPLVAVLSRCLGAPTSLAIVGQFRWGRRDTISAVAGAFLCDPQRRF
jgi:hypothetical protein